MPVAAIIKHITKSELPAPEREFVKAVIHEHILEIDDAAEKATGRRGTTCESGRLVEQRDSGPLRQAHFEIPSNIPSFKHPKSTTRHPTPAAPSREKAAPRDSPSQISSMEPSKSQHTPAATLFFPKAQAALPRAQCTMNSKASYTSDNTRHTRDTDTRRGLDSKAKPEKSGSGQGKGEGNGKSNGKGKTQRGHYANTRSWAVEWVD